MAKIDGNRLENALVRLEAAQTWNSRLVRRLERLIADGTDEEVFRVNPRRFAGEHGIGEGEAIDLFLHAAMVGLMRMDWLMLCPMCGCVVESLAELTGIAPQFHCTLCHAGFETALDDYVAVTFTVAPSIRETAFHHPEALAVDRYVFDYCVSRDAEVPEGFLESPEGAPWRDAWRRAFFDLRFLAPGQRVEIAVVATPGVIESFDPHHGTRLVLPVVGPPATAEQDVSAVLTDAGWQPAVRAVKPGPLRLRLENQTTIGRPFGMVRMPVGYAHKPLRFRRFLSASDLLNNQTFRELYRAERIRGREGLAVRDVTILFTDIAGSTALYDRLGDLNAFSLVQQHFSLLQERVARHQGAVIKTIGDAVMASFSSPMDAVAAATEVQLQTPAAGDVGADPAILVKIGLHRGAAIAVTLNDQLDYFGQTVNAAARLQRTAEPGDICVSETVGSYPGVAPLLEPFAVERQIGHFRGMDRALAFLRLTLRRGD